MRTACLSLREMGSILQLKLNEVTLEERPLTFLRVKPRKVESLWWSAHFRGVHPRGGAEGLLRPVLMGTTFFKDYV